MFGADVIYICKEHIACIGCPLENNGIQTQNGVVFCEKAVNKEKDKEEN